MASSIDRAIVNKNRPNRLIILIAKALAARELGIRLLNTFISSLPLITETAVKSIRARVLVLIPPAVEVGEPPINIWISIINLLASVRPPISIVEIPAVLDPLA